MLKLPTLPYYIPKNLQSIFNPVKITKNLLWRYGARISESPHIFVIGAPRSGTTLMFSILASHSSFAAINNETYFFTFRDIFKLNNYSRLSEFGGSSLEQFENLLDESRDLVDFYDGLAQFMFKRDGGYRFIEKTPSHTLYLKYLVKHFPKAQFINMIRDGRDCYVSYSRLPYCKSIEQCATLWRDSIRIRQQFKNCPQIIDIKYEDLVNQPEATTQIVMDFVGEKFLVNQVSSKSYSNRQIFTKHSGHERLNQPIKPTTVGKWRQKLTAKQISIFNEIAGKELKALMYNV